MDKKPQQTNLHSRVTRLQSAPVPISSGKQKAQWRQPQVVQAQPQPAPTPLTPPHVDVVPETTPAPILPEVPNTPPFTVIYDWAPTAEIPEVAKKIDRAGAKPYILVYQNIDPECAKTGIINSDLIIRHVRQNHGDNPSGWGMLDYEFPFDEVFHAGPDHPQWGRCAKTMLEALAAVKAAFPRVRWTYYGMPGLLYWVNGKLWAFAKPEDQQAEIERQIRGYGPVLEALDWYNPCVYDVYDLGKMDPDSRAQHLINERVYREARIGVVREFMRRSGITGRPILPAVSPFFTGHGNSTGNQRIPHEEMVRDQVHPVVTSGCEGMAIWSAADWYASTALRATNPNNQVQTRIRPVFTADYFGGTEPKWGSPETRTTLLAGLGNAIADMAVAGVVQWGEE